ncbi:MAG: DNA polymerase III subunit beta [Alphaproteobacteria bacterium]|nr:DNA polymerase III subunit beta [Alphaproteobacteria bacterium]
MKFTIDRVALLRALAHVQSVVERRSTIPVLSNVKMKAENGTLILSTTDMDIEMTEAIAVDVEKNGECTAPAFTLYDIIRKLPDSSKVTIDLDPTEKSITVRSGRSDFRLSCLPVSDFPQFGGTDYPISFGIRAADLRALIDRTKFAMSTEETRYYLNGIYLHSTQNEGLDVLRAVSTDGHRLARFEMPLPEGAKDMPGIIIPRKMVVELGKLLEEAADEIKISLSPNKISVAFDHIILTSKLIDGTFPDYARVIPQGNDKIIEVDPKLFSSAIDRVSTISDGKSRAVKITLNGKIMTLSATSADAGSAKEEIEVRSEMPNFEVGFNARYLLDITSQVDSEGGCRLSLSDPSAPTIIEDTSDPSALYVLMPLRV